MQNHNTCECIINELGLPEEEKKNLTQVVAEVGVSKTSGAGQRWPVKMNLKVKLVRLTYST